jgi:hypothetical protein
MQPPCSPEQLIVQAPSKPCTALPSWQSRRAPTRAAIDQHPPVQPSHPCSPPRCVGRPTLCSATTPACATHASDPPPSAVSRLIFSTASRPRSTTKLQMHDTASKTTASPPLLLRLHAAHSATSLYAPACACTTTACHANAIARRT